MIDSYDRKYLSIAFPAAFEGLFMILLASADLIMVGTLGAVSIAAVSIFIQPRLIVLCFSRSLASAVTLLVSREAGRGDKKTAAGLLKKSLFIGSAVFLPIHGIFYFYLEDIFFLMGAEPEYMTEALAYGEIAVISVFITSVTTLFQAVQLGFGAIASRKVTKPAQGHFDKAGVTPRRHLLELRTANASEFTLGQELTAELFAGGEVVDVTGTTKGKGTAGVMKRHGFGGLKGSHGVHRKHRAPGSIGGCSTPGRVFKGLRMAGRMGNAKVTVQNLKIHAVDAERGLLLVRGAVPGNNGSLVVVRSAAKKGEQA